MQISIAELAELLTTLGCYFCKKHPVSSAELSHSLVPLREVLKMADTPNISFPATSAALIGANPRDADGNLTNFEAGTVSYVAEDSSKVLLFQPTGEDLASITIPEGADSRDFIVVQFSNTAESPDVPFNVSLNADAQEGEGETPFTLSFTVTPSRPGSKPVADAGLLLLSLVPLRPAATARKV